jgi:hypothetical protein
MSENNDEINRIVELNDLFEEMLKDARNISKDLTEGITNTGVASLLAMVIALIQLLILRENFWRGPAFIGIWAIGFIVILYNGVRGVQKYLTLKNRYARFFEINKELEKM